MSDILPATGPAAKANDNVSRAETLIIETRALHEALHRVLNALPQNHPSRPPFLAALAEARAISAESRK